MTAPEIIDRAALAALLETVGGDQEFLDELIATYFDDAAELLSAMDRAIAAGEGAELRRAAHSLKSNSATFGATRLAALCQELEQRARDNDLADATERLAAIEAEYERVRPALEERAQGT